MNQKIRFTLSISALVLFSTIVHAQNVCGTAIGTSDYIENLANGDYAVVVTNANGCTVTASTSISNTNNLTLTLYPSQNHCNITNGAYITTSAYGGEPFTYHWSNGATTDYIENLANGDYTVTVTNSNGCTATATTTISNTNNLTVTLYPSQNHCNVTNGAYITTSAYGAEPFTYHWSTGATTDYIENLTNGNYTVTVTNSNGCTTTASSSISNTNNLTVTLYPSQNHCNVTNGGYITTSVYGAEPFTYHWSNGATTDYIENLTNGNYTVTVTNSNGCTTTASSSISNTNNLTVTLYPSQNHCNVTNGAYITTSAYGAEPFTYHWSTGATTDYIENLTNGNYTVTVTNSNGCTTTASSSISNTNNLTVTLYPSQNHCNLTNGAYITTSVYGGEPFTYHWSTGATTDYIENLTNGNYAVTVTNSNGCIITATSTISNTNNLTVTLYPSQNHCSITNGAYITSSAYGAEPFTYQWYLLTPGSQPIISQSGQLLTSTSALNYQWMLNGTDISGANSQTYTALVSGTYTVRVTYANNCVSISSPAQVNVVTGIENMKEEKSLSVYPNPAKNNLFVQIERPTALVISNLLGETVLQTNLELLGNLDISTLSPGVYFIYNQQRTSLAKFVKEQ